MGGSLCKAGMDLWFQNIPSPQEVQLFQLLRLNLTASIFPTCAALDDSYLRE